MHALAPTGAWEYLSNMDAIFNILIPVALAVVFVVLCFGIYALFRGGDFGRSWSNRAMRMRILAQFVAVLILMAALIYKQHWGG